MIGRLPFSLVVLAGIWLGGFLLFADHVRGLDEPAVSPELKHADAVVVLTGGSERLGVGLQLLQSGAGEKLFISGVHKGVTLERLLGAQPVPPELRACCIVMGMQAESTIGNAAETRAWMAKEGYHSLRLVTANYHMPRSLLLFRAAMPDAEIIPHPVAPDSVKLRSWTEHPGTFELLLTEYNKFLVAHVKVWMER